MHFKIAMLLFLLLGLIFGSFLNVLIYRLPKDQSIVYPSSYCVFCEKSISWFHNIPILSFLFLRGKSSCCSKKIPFRYPFVEFASSMLWVWSYYNIEDISGHFLFLMMSSCLLVIIFTDYMHFLIPLELNLLMFLSCLSTFIITDKDNLYSHFFSMFLLVAYFLVLMWIVSFLMKKDSMGYGDVILIGVLSFWLGLFDIFLIVFFASLLSIIHWVILKIVKKDDNIVLPFGSTISLATILIFIIKVTLQLETNFF